MPPTPVLGVAAGFAVASVLLWQCFAEGYHWAYRSGLLERTRRELYWRAVLLFLLVWLVAMYEIVKLWLEAL